MHVLLDISDTFHTVGRGICLQRLLFASQTSQLSSWFRSYAVCDLTVAVNCLRSVALSLQFGIPQGSVGELVTFVSVTLCLSLSVSLFVCLSVSPQLCLCLSVCLYVRLSISLVSVSLSSHDEATVYHVDTTKSHEVFLSLSPTPTRTYPHPPATHRDIHLHPTHTHVHASVNNENIHNNDVEISLTVDGTDLYDLKSHTEAELLSKGLEACSRGYFGPNCQSSALGHET